MVACRRRPDGGCLCTYATVDLREGQAARLRGGGLGLVRRQVAARLDDDAQREQVVHVLALAPAGRQVVQPQQLLHRAEQRLGAPMHVRPSTRRARLQPP